MGAVLFSWGLFACLSVRSPLRRALMFTVLFSHGCDGHSLDERFTVRFESDPEPRVRSMRGPSAWKEVHVGQDSDVSMP